MASNKSRHGRRRQRFLELLEPRLALAGLPPVAMDDAYEVLGPPDPNILLVSDSFVLEVLSNDTIPGAAMSLTITQPPEHGTVFIDDHHHFQDDPVDWTRADDESSPLGDGHASALSGVVDSYGQLKLKVAQYADGSGLGGVSNHSATPGDYALYIRLGASDFTNFDPLIFDYEFRDYLITQKIDAYNIPRLTPGTPFIAWIDNTVGNGTPDTYLFQLGRLEVRYVPEPGYHGEDLFRYTITDEDGQVSNEATVTVSNLNAAPVVENGRSETTIDTPIEITVYGEDSDGTVDPTSVEIVAGPTQGTLEFQGTEYYWAKFLYTPRPDALSQDSFQFTFRDNDGTVSNIGTVSITISDGVPVNVPPIAEDVSGSGLPNTPLTIDVLSNASDSDGTLDPATLQITVPPEHGSATIQTLPSGPVVVYTPDADHTGEDEFRFTVRDDQGAISEPATAYLSIGPIVNHSPQAFGYSVTTGMYVATTLEVLSYVFDSDGSIDASSLVITAQPSHGSATIESHPAGPRVLYMPGPGFFGEDVVYFTARDNEGAVSNVGSATIIVQPITRNDQAATPRGTSVSINVLANDIPFSGGVIPASLQVLSGPARGSVDFQNTASGRVAVYTPAVGNSATLVVDDPIDRDDGNYLPGHLSLREAIKLANKLANDNGYTDSFSYQVMDDQGQLSNPAVVTIRVAPHTTTITFAPSLTSRGPRTLTLTQVGDTSEGNSALAIRSPIKIVGSTGNKRITLAGPGSSGDLRLLFVASGGELTVENLRLASGATDGSGGALAVAGNAKATLSNVALENNFAYDKGGAIYSFGELLLVNCQFSGNEAYQGGAISTWGSLEVSGGTFSKNRAEFGGAIDIGLGTATIARATLATNVATDRGGGIFNAGELTLQQVTLRGNRAREGGGLFNLGAATINGSQFLSNQADQGAGLKNGTGTPVVGPIFERAGTLTLNSTNLFGNTALQGGGLYNVGQVNVTGGLIGNNQATTGGGIFTTDAGLLNDAARVSLHETTLSGNKADQGAGIYVDLGSVQINGSTLSGNVAKVDGGAVFNNSYVTLLNATLAANSAKAGGGLYNAAGLAQIVSTTIADNTAPRGGGLYNEIGYLSLVSSIVAGNRSSNQASDLAGLVSQGSQVSHHNVIGTGGSGGLVDGEADNRVGVNPLLAALRDYGGPVKTFALLPGSPAIEQGWGDQADARGQFPFAQRDSGAFESQGFTLTRTGGDGQTARHDTSFAKPLKVTVTPNNPAEPVVGGVVTFTAPGDGVTAKLSATRATIGASRTASVTARANQYGGSYQVMAAAAGADSVDFTLTNVGPAAPQPVTSPPAASFPAVAASNPANPAAPNFNQLLTLPAAGYTELPADTTEYKLDRGGRLLMRNSQGWTAIANGVKSFLRAPNGDLYVLNEQQELRRFQLGFYWSTVHTGVNAIAIDGEGTIHALDNFAHITTYAGLDRYYVLPEFPEEAEKIARDPPSDGEVMLAAQLSNGGEAIGLNGEVQFAGFFEGFVLRHELDFLLGMEFSETVLIDGAEQTIPGSYGRVRFVKDKITDTVEAPRQFPGVGWAELHHAQYKVTFYYTTVFNDDGQSILYLNHDHLHLVAPPTTTSPTRNSEINTTSQLDGATGARPLSSPTIGGVYRDEVAPALMTGPDGTLYKFGVYDNLWIATGIEPGTHSLWRLRLDGNWESIFRAFAFSVGPDNTLYVLDGAHELQSIAPETSALTTLDRNILKFSMAPDGTLFALTADHTLQKLPAGSRTWITLDVEVPDFALTNNGTLFAINSRLELRRLRGSATWTVLDRGVTTIALTEGNVLYALNGRQELRTWTGNESSKIVLAGIQKFSRERDGTSYVLTTGKELRRMRVGETWEVVDRGIVSYLVNYNGDLYEINERRELKREKFGYSWSTLQSNVVSIHYDSFGSIHALDGLGQVRNYTSLDRYFALAPLTEGGLTTALDPPSDYEAITGAAMDSGWGLGQGRVNFPYALANDIQGFLPGPEFPLQREAAALDSFFASESFQSWLAPEETGDEAATLSASLALLSEETGSDISFRNFTVHAGDRDRREFDLSAYNNVRIIKEKVADKIDPPRYFPEVGWAQVHHAQYKITIYYSALVDYLVIGDISYALHYGNDEQYVFFIDHDHLHRYEPGSYQPPPANAAAVAALEVSSEPERQSRVADAVAAPVLAGSPLQRSDDTNTAALITAPDGTLYRLGGGDSNYLAVGSEPGPSFLHKMRPSGLWVPVDFVYDFAVGPDSQLYILDMHRVLRTPALGPTHWATLATDVQSMFVTKGGDLFVLRESGELLVQRHGSSQLASLATGITALMKSPGDTIYTLNDRQELRQVTNTSPGKLMERGVASIAMTSDGALYAVNGSGEFKRYRDTGAPKILAREVASMQVAPDGGVFALTRAQALMKLTARDHWTVLDSQVLQFQIVPNGDLYLINAAHELRRQKVGYSWTTLQSDVQSLTAYSDGTIYAVDSQGISKIYTSLGLYYALAPFTPGEPTVALDAPWDGEVQLAANFTVFPPPTIEFFPPGPEFPFHFESADLEASGANPSTTPQRSGPALLKSSTVLPIPDLIKIYNVRIITEKRFEEIDPGRYVTNLGPAQLHRVQYECTVYFDSDDAVDQQLTVFIDHDHYHLI